MKKIQDYSDTFDEDPGEPQSLSLMGGIATGGSPGDGQGYLGDHTAEKRKATQQSVLIGGIVTVVAFGALLGMRLTQGEIAVAVSKDTKKFMDNLDVRLNSMNGNSKDPLSPANIAATFRDTDAIVAAIEEDPTVKQVPLEQVQMNPFSPLHAKAVVGTDNSLAEAEAERAEQLDSLHQELGNIKVQSLVGGSRPRAFIDGNLYKVGDTVGSFTITQIDNRAVQFKVIGFEPRPGEPAFALGMSAGK